MDRGDGRNRIEAPELEQEVLDARSLNEVPTFLLYLCYAILAVYVVFISYLTSVVVRFVIVALSNDIQLNLPSSDDVLLFTSGRLRKSTDSDTSLDK